MDTISVAVRGGGNSDKTFCLPWEQTLSFWGRPFFAPLMRKFLPFRADPFSEGHWYAGKQTGCLSCTNWGNPPSVSSPLERFYNNNVVQ